MLASGCAVAVVLLVLTATAAHAHTVLLSSEPADGASVAALPSTVALHFSDPVQLDGATVALVSGGTRVALSAVRIGSDATTVFADVPVSAPAVGPVGIEWRVLAADGHLASGTVSVGVGGSAAGAVSAAARMSSGDPDLVRGLFVADRLVGYLALTVLCGGIFFLAVVWPTGAGVARARRLLWGAWTAGIVTAIGGILLETSTVAGGDLGEATRAGSLRAVLATPFGRAWAARAVLFVLAIPLLAALRVGGRTVVRQPWFVVAAAAVGIGLLRTPGFVAHSSEGDMGAVGSIADLLHLLGVAVWLGGLVMLVAAVLPRRRSAELADVVPRFSRVALVAIFVTIAGGAVMTWDIAGSLASLTSTDWGHLLLAKVGVFASILVAASVSKRWVDDRLRIAVALRGHASIVRPFLLSVAAEAVLAATAIGIASALVATSPGR